MSLFSEHINRMMTANTGDRRLLKPFRFRGLRILAFAGLWLLTACATPPQPAPGAAGETGLASYYADRFHGRKTASGERYDRDDFTAAHRRLPFGTRVRVTRTDTGQTVVVRVNDRGPFVKGRVIDLSYAAARKIGMLRKGLVAVRVVPID